MTEIDFFVKKVDAAKYLEELKKIDLEIYTMALLSYETGARLSELFKLKKSHFRGKHIHLGRLFYKGTGRFILLKSELQTLLEILVINKKSDSLIFSKDLKEVHRAIAQVNNRLGVKNYTFRSFRQTFIKRLFQTFNPKKTDELPEFLEMIGFHKKMIKRKYIDAKLIDFKQFQAKKGGEVYVIK